jgi:two-component system sensor histidine kinase MtrB
VVSTLLSRAGTVTPEDQKALLESADRQARRLEALANDLLDLARMDQGRLELELEEVDVQELTRSALSYVENGGDIQTDIDPGLKVMADPRRLEQVLINLAGNALRHGAPPVLVTGRANGNIASIEVVDHGVGVPEKELSRLFEPFNTERKSGSIGYGLAIVKALIEAHGGTVAYSNEKGGGARFRLTLDRAPTSAT